MRQRRLFLMRILAAIAAFSFLSSNFLFPQLTSASLSSLDTPSAAEIAALESSYVAAPDVAAEVTATAESGTTEVSGSYVGKAVIGVTGAELGIAGLTAAGIQSLQQKAADKYCATNSNALVCRYLPLVYNCTDGVNIFRAPPSWNPGYTCRGITSAHGWSLASNLSSIAAWGDSNGGGGFPVPSDTLSQYAGGRLPWNQWDASSRNAAVGNLLASDYQNAMTESTSALPQSSDPTITVSGTNTAGTFYQDSSGVWHYVPGNPVTIPNPNPIPFPSLSPSSSNSPTPSPSPSNSPTPSPSPSNSPTPSPSPNSDCGITDDMWRDLEDINNPKVGDPTTPEGRTISTHAQESLQRHGFQEPYSDVDDIIDNYSRQTPQADLATAYIKANKDGTYNLAIVNKQDGRIITAMKDLSLKALKKLGEGYGFDPNP